MIGPYEPCDHIGTEMSFIENLTVQTKIKTISLARLYFYGMQVNEKPPDVIFSVTYCLVR